MKKNILILCLFLIGIPTLLLAQERVLLRGKVLYNDLNVSDLNVINATANKATITNSEGEFEILVQLHDRIAFSGINYQLRTVEITEEILRKNRLIVEVKEKITELDEVVVSSDSEKFLELKNEEFKKELYASDYSTKIENKALSNSELGMQYGLNITNIAKALAKALGKKDQEQEIPFNQRIKLSEVLRDVYDDYFFTEGLKIPQDKIDAYLFYCDEKLPSQDLLKKNNEFFLIEFLVKQSEQFNALFSN